MDAKQFLAEFGHIVNAPEGVKRLRELILQLAIQGDLSERVLNDIPAEILFESNQNEKRKQISEGTIPRQKPIAKVDRKDHPWDLPDSWKWCRLGEVTTYGVTLKAEYSDVTDETWVLELEDIEKQTSTLVKKIRAKERRFRSSKNRFLANYVLYGKLRPYLDKVVLADEDGVCTTEIMPISVFDGVVPAYLRWYLKSPFFINYANNSTHGMNLPRMGTEAGRFAMFALPPKEEQIRIVAKVDELMALCDKLEAQQQKRRKLQTLTRITALDALANAQSPHELKDAWLRVQSNMSLMFNEPEDVVGLRKLILDSAIKGNLVIQKPDDTDASKLVLEIAKEKERLLKNKKIANQTKFQPVKEEERPFNLPKGWVFVRLGAITNKIGSGSTPRGGKSVYVNKGVPFLRSQNIWNDGIRMHDVAYIPENTHEKMTNTVVMPKDILLNITGASLGRCALVPDDFEQANVSQHVTIIRATNLETRLYLHLCMLSPYAQKMIWGRQVGMAREGLSKKVLEQFEIPLPPIEEQGRIVEKVASLMTLCDELENHFAKAKTTARKLAQAAVASITGTNIKEDQKMKTPTTELVSKLKLKVSPNNKDQAPLSAILAKHNGELSSKALWNYSGLEIDAFYQQLKTEMARDWIVEPEKSRMIEKDADNQSEAEAEI
ncbi:restriction endonuclease subunit S [Methylotuvimicrobium sp.]|uniref:restriction endonuclease subunit S n=1 Tax=Methylotuvimicrobium sp. TaxID=2822413 RepID=UPI003D6521AD